jgi:hypothetical protein
LVVLLYRISGSDDILRVTIASLLQASLETNRTPPFAHKMEIVKEIPFEQASKFLMCCLLCGKRAGMRQTDPRTCVFQRHQERNSYNKRIEFAVTMKLSKQSLNKA